MYQAKFIIKTKNGSILKRKTKVYDLELDVDARIKYYTYKLFKEGGVDFIKIIKINLETLNFENIIFNSKNKMQVINKDYSEMYLKRLRDRDYQQKKVYAWERDNFSKYGMFFSNFSELKMTAFCEHVLRKVNIPKIQINYIGNKDRSYFKFSKLDDVEILSLNFSNLTLNKLLAIHELSHYIVYYKKLPDVGHGKYFVGVYAYLLINFIGFDKDGIYNTLRGRSIDYLEYEKVEQYFINTELYIN